MTVATYQSQILAGQRQFQLDNVYLTGGSINLADYNTPEARNQMKIPDIIHGAQWAIFDNNGSVIFLAEITPTGLNLGDANQGVYASADPNIGITIENVESGNDHDEMMIFGSDSGSGSGYIELPYDSYYNQSYGTGPTSDTDADCEGDSSSGGGSNGGGGANGGGGGVSAMPSGPRACVKGKLGCRGDEPGGGGVGPGSGGGDCPPCEEDAGGGTSGGPIRYSDGKIIERFTDLQSSGGGITWSHTRSYDNQSFSDLDYHNGKRWKLDSIPTLRFFNSSLSVTQSGALGCESVQVSFGGKFNSTFDKLGNGTFVSHGKTKATLTHDPSQEVYVVRRANGEVWKFHDFTNPLNARGCLKSMTTSGGATLSMTYNTDKTPAIVRRTFVESSVTKHEDFVYSYVNCPDGVARIEYVTLRRSSDNGQTWTELNRVKYVYYGSNDSYGNVGDLKTATTQTKNGSNWNNLATDYYRYYKNGQSKGFKHGLKFIFESGDYAGLVAAGTPDSMNDTQVAAFATKYFEYNSSNRRAVLEKIQGGSKTLSFQNTKNSVSSNANAWYSRTTETFPNGSRKTVYTNTEGKVLLTSEEKSQGTSDPKIVNFYVYDAAGRLVKHVTPDAVSSYSDYGNYGSTLNVTVFSDRGLIRTREYYNGVTGQPNGYLAKEFVQKGNNGTPILVKKYEYVSRTANDQTIWRSSKITSYANENGTGAVDILFAYEFASNSQQITQKTTTFPTVAAAQNGANTTATRVERYDDYGRLVWTKDELGIITHHKYDLALGVRLRTIQDVNTLKTTDFGSPVPSGWSTASGAGKHLVSDLEYDTYGRIVQTLGPKNTVVNDSNQSIDVRPASWTVYDDVAKTIRQASGYATVNSSGTITAYTLANPVNVTKYDAKGNAVEQIQASRASNSGKLLETDTFAQSSYVAWSKNSYDAAGYLTSTRRYFSIPTSGDGAKDTNYLETTFAYDAMGRQNRTVSPDGTITRIVHDWRGNAVQTWIGTNDTGATDAKPKSTNSANNMVVVSETEYGGGAGCSSCCSAKDKPRVAIQHVDDTNIRVTEFGYDWRGRQTHVHSDDDAEGNMTYTVQTYDNMDRVVKSEKFLLTPNASSGGGGGSDSYSDSYYWGSEGGSDSSDATTVPKIDTNNPLDDILLARSEHFYDTRGRIWKTEQSVVDPATGTVQGKLQSQSWFDAKGRVIKQIEPGARYHTKYVYDSLGQLTKIYVAIDAMENTYATASNVTGDTVFTQTEMAYDNWGNTLLQAYYERLSTATGTGALTIAKTRPQFMAFWYDATGRQIATANYGTNNGSALTRPATVPTRSDTILVTETKYDTTTGRAFRTIDPAGKDHRTFYDTLGRTTKTVANYTGSGTVSASTPDQNVTVEMAYHASGQLSQLVAKNPTTGDQITKYVYGSGKAWIAPLVYRNDLLAAEIYPDSDDTENSSGIIQNGSDGVVDRVEFQYNRAGERIWKRDQNGTVHNYEYDNLGRLLHDRVTTLASGVDGTVRRISTEYDYAGNVKTLTSYNNASTSLGTVVNQLRYEYDVNGQLQKEYSATSGAVNVSATPCIQYTYDTTKSGGVFTKSLRPTSVTYPGGRIISYEYGTNGSPDDLFSRYTGVKDGNTTLVTYVDNGVSTPVRITYNEPGLTLDYTTTGALDRFGRITDHAWKKGATDIARIKHAYDRIGNRLYRQDLAATAASKSFDELYAYDGMNQLVDMQRGTLNTAKTAVTNKTQEESFNFDATGNWLQCNNDVTEIRTHNKANEIQSICTHDRNGNMTVMPGLKAKYDAWNRLVEIRNSGNTLLATYSYNGLNHRVKKVVGNETRYFYFNSEWQCLEERVGTSSTADLTYTWGLRYIDDLVCRDRNSERFYSLADPNWNVVALCNTSGEVQERLAYNAFGKLNWLDANFVTKTASGYAWTRTFTGQVYDNETDLMLYRNRFYHTYLGRFVTRDPIGYDAEDANLYRYVFDIPNSSFDPFGFTIFIGGSGVVARPIITRPPVITRPTTSPRPIPVPGRPPARQPFPDLPPNYPQPVPRPIITRPVANPRPVPYPQPQPMAPPPDGPWWPRGPANDCPESNCSEERGKELHDEVVELCRGEKRSCKENDTLAVLQEKMLNNKKCRDARKQINDECFDGGDTTHKKMHDEAEIARVKCAKIIGKNFLDFYP